MSTSERTQYAAKTLFSLITVPCGRRSVRISECDTNAPELQTKHTEATSEGVRGLAVTAPNVEQGVQGLKSRKKLTLLVYLRKLM